MISVQWNPIGDGLKLSEVRQKRSNYTDTSVSSNELVHHQQADPGVMT